LQPVGSHGFKDRHTILDLLPGIVPGSKEGWLGALEPNALALNLDCPSLRARETLASLDLVSFRKEA
jgi:hypothetical protein